MTDFHRPLGRISLGILVVLTSLSASGQEPYRKPPQAIQQALDARLTPQLSVSPTRDHLLLVEVDPYATIAEMAAPMLRLAGLRISPQTNGPHRTPRITGLEVQTLDGKPRRIELPAGARLAELTWSPKGRMFAFSHTTLTGIELWVGDAEEAKVRQIPGVALNAVLGDAVEWLPDGETLLCRTVVAGRGPAPEKPAAPVGPVIEESFGKQAPVRTYQDLLTNSHDEKLFEHYATAQLVRVHPTSGKIEPLGSPAIFGGAETSADGQYLLVARIVKPFSYRVTVDAFAKEVEIWDRAGKVAATLARLPVADEVPIEGVPTGPRSFQWRPTAPGDATPATVLWAEALDGGDPRTKAPHRDKVLKLTAPFTGQAAEVWKTEHRYAGLTFAASGQALLRDYDRDRRWIRTTLVDIAQPAEASVVWERSIRDRYGDPGTPVQRTLANGQRVLWLSGDAMFLSGPGASPEGDRPFLDRFDLKSRKTERLFHSAAGSYETPAAMLDAEAGKFLTRHESPSEPPNYYLRTVAGERKALTQFTDPLPQLRKIQKQIVTYKRPDGVQLSFTLYLPPDFQPGQPRPAVVWAYPQEFNDPSTAGQVVGSSDRFTTLAGSSHLFYLLAGYVVLDGATMPVVGDPETANNTFIEQIVASAQAAIDKAVEMGVADRQRIGVGGHSYGAFMTANLLAHSELFKAGVARSGAYNRTLTPFGFQSERRTLWEAPDVYMRVSPLLHAQKIKEPLLLIHGEADNNAGTYPMQSERLFHAIRGNGGNVRYVVLPHESHGYAARESIEHTLYEMIGWFDRFVKGTGTSEGK